MMDKLTDRENEVIALIQNGVGRPKQIADAMDLAPKTIRNHLDSICNKFGIDGRQGPRVAQLLTALSRAKLPWQEAACSDMLNTGKSLSGIRSTAMAYTPHDFDVIRCDDYPDLLEVVEQPRFDERGRFNMTVIPYGWTQKNPQTHDEFPPEIIISDLSTVTLVKRPGPPDGWAKA